MRRRRRRWSPFERRQRRAARGALYGSLVLIGALMMGLVAYLDSLELDLEPMRWLEQDYRSMPEVELLKRYVQIDTSIGVDRTTSGNEIAGARFLASVLEEAGIPATVEDLGEGRANLWAILEGESREALVLHNHIDTDPVEDPEIWRHPPFSGTIEGPWIFGRGAFDMKAIAVAQLEAMIRLKESGRPLTRSVIFLATGSEEVGSDLGMKWILRHHPELAERFWAVLTEGGAVESRAAGDVKYWGIEFAQKHYVDVVLCSASREPLDELRQQLLDVREDGGFAVRLTPEVEAFLTPYAPTRDREDYRQLLAAPGRLAVDALTFLDLPLYLKAMFRDEALPYPVEERPEGGFQLIVKFHLLPGTDFERVRPELLPEWMTHGLGSVTYDEGGARRGSPLDHPVFLEAKAVLEESYPDAVVGPYFLPWVATDSRFVRAAGIPSYGFTPFLVVSFDTSRIGGVDERIELPAFIDGIEIYRRLVERLAL